MWLPVRTGTYWVHTVLLILVLHFSYFWRVHAEYILILGQYVLLVRDSIAHMPGPAGLLASYSPAHALIQITRKHWQVYSLLLGSTLVSAWAPGLWRWLLAGGFSCCWSASPDSLQPWLTQLSAHQQNQPQPATPCTLQTGVWRNQASSWGVNYELQNIQAILPSSSSEIFSER